MMPWSCRKPHELSPIGRESGVMAVEFIFLLPVLLLIIVGIVEFGHLFSVRHTLTNASREGARAAVVYNGLPDGSAKQNWAEAAATAAVTQYMADTKFAGTWNKTITAGTKSGETVKVTVTAPGSLLLLDTFIPALNNVTVAAETTMKME
jgi:Flp pilus assembly protein TadG